MPNSIALISKYVSLLDEVYKQSTLTSNLEASSERVRQGSQTNQILFPKMALDGLGDYSRSTGYTDGTESLTWETKTFNYDRGRKFSVDAMDDEETAGISFGMLSSEFIRTKVVPELDAWRFAVYAGKAGTKATNQTYATGDAIVGALTTANTTLDEAEVPAEGRYLFITPTLYNLIIALDSFKSKAMLDGYEEIVKVPQTRFYSAITLLDGKTSGEEIGGYSKASAGKNLNFMVIQKNSPLQFTKHRVTKIITPEQNQTSDSWMFAYRAYGITDVYDNKQNGIYASVAAS